MKLLLLGCLHGGAPKRIARVAKKEKPDAILYAGDLCDVDKLRDIEFGNWNTKEILEAVFSRKKYLALTKEAANSMQKSLDFLAALKVPVLLVYGNNDFVTSELKNLGIAARSLEKRLPKNVHLLEDELVKIGDFYVAGFPGYRGTAAKLLRGGKHEKRLRQLFKKIRYPKQTLLLTHDVPYNKFDVVKWKKSPALGKHVGEKLFNK